ncbi:MAG TPA: glycosyltransferase family 87 protein [Chloroflexota bacterium]|nr:glycosyltransferase family 87 protein [Chloroflexota bacterium]
MTSRAIDQIRQRLGAVVLQLDALLTWRRVHQYPFLTLACGYGIGLVAIARGYAPFTVYGRPFATDLAARLTAGRIVVFGDPGRLYDFAYQYQVQQQLIGEGHPEFFQVFLPPPFDAYLYAPFASLPYVASATILTVLTILMVIASFRLLWPLVPGLHRYGFWFVLAIVFSSWPLIDLIVGGQDSAIGLFVYVVALRLLLARRDGLAGATFALGLYKPQMFLLVPVLLVGQKRWRALATSSLTGLGLAAFSVVAVGPVAAWTFVKFLLSGTSGSTTVGDFGWKMMSGGALVTALLPAPLAFLVVPATIAVVVAVGILFVRAALRPAVTNREFQLLYALCIIAGGIVNPHFFTYDCTVLVPAFLIAFEDAPGRPIVRVSIAAAYILTWLVAALHLLVVQAPWPVSLIAAPWVVVPLVSLTVFVTNRLQERHGVPTGGRVVVDAVR